MSSDSNGTLKNCGACKQGMERSAFSKKQWERKKFRRCKACVENETPFQRPSKKEYQQPEKKENLMVPPPPSATKEEKPQVASEERPPLDPVGGLADNNTANAFKSLVSYLEQPMPAEMPATPDRIQRTMNVVADESIPMATQTEKGAKAAKEEGTDDALDFMVLSAATKWNTIRTSTEGPSESVLVPAAAVSDDETKAVQQQYVPVPKANMDVDVPQPTPQHRKDPVDYASDVKTSSNAPFASLLVAAKAPSTASITPSRVEEMVQEHDAIFRAVFEEPTKDQEQQDQYDDQQLLHRVSTEDVMEYEVEPIVNVEQEIFDLLNPSFTSSEQQGIRFVDDSSKLLNMEDAEDDSPIVSSSSSSQRQESMLANVPDDTMSNEEQASHTNVEDIGTTTTDHSSADASPPPAAALDIQTRERIESDAQDWDPSAMARLSPIASTPPSPPTIPPIETEDDEEEASNSSNDEDDNKFCDMHTLVGFSCFVSILALMLVAILLPHNHALQLVLATVAVGAAGIVLVSFLLAKEKTSRNDTTDDVNSLREPLLSGATEDGEMISDVV